MAGDGSDEGLPVDRQEPARSDGQHARGTWYRLEQRDLTEGITRAEPSSLLSVQADGELAFDHDVEQLAHLALGHRWLRVEQARACATMPVLLALGYRTGDQPFAGLGLE